MRTRPLSLRLAITAAAILITTSACGPYSMKQLKDRPSGIITFQTNRNYQAVYRSILFNLREELQGHIFLAHLGIHGDLYHDIQTGQISAVLSPHGTHFLSVEIVGLGEDQTEVTSYFLHEGWRRHAEKAKVWAEE